MAAKKFTDDDDYKSIPSFFEGKNCLVAVSNTAMRAMIRGVLSFYGVTPLQVFASKNFREANQYLEEKKPEIIITEFEFDEHFGIELSIMQKEYTGDLNQRLFFLIADSGLESSVAAAAEEEVDAYLIRPISEQAFSDYLSKSVQAKLQPSELTKNIAQVRQLLAANNYDQAKTLLTVAQLDNPHPTYYYYLGFIAQQKGDVHDALKQFEIGLNLSPRHFKCLYGKFMCLYGLERKLEAFHCVSEIKKIYPLTPELLKYAFVVVVETYNFDAVEEYYKIYLRQVRKPDSLKQIVSTALLTCGRAMLRKSPRDINRVLEYFVKGSIISGRQAEFIETIIRELIDHKQTEHLNRFFDMFKEGDISENVIRPLRFKQWVRESRDEHFLLNEGKRIILDAHADDFTISYVLNLARNMGKANLLQTLVFKLCELHPQRRPEFVAYLDA